MRAYVCVYRHPVPSPRYRKQTEEAALTNPLLRDFLDGYFKTGSLFDWGDDPSFFAATHLLGDPRMATWGVCRRDVRDSLAPGDFVVFICGRQATMNESVWEYFYVGVATLSLPLKREVIWNEWRYSEYRKFLNVLARPDQNGHLRQYEFVHRYHDDWRERCSAPYWLFDRGDSFFNIENALHIATYDGVPGAIEEWHTRNPQIRQLRSLLLRGAKPTRGLRSTNAQRAHPKLNLGGGYHSDDELIELRSKLFDLLGH